MRPAKKSDLRVRADGDLAPHLALVDLDNGRDEFLGVKRGAKGVEIIEDRFRIVDPEAQACNARFRGLKMPMPRDDEMRCDLRGVVGLVVSGCRAERRADHTVDQCDFCQILQRTTQIPMHRLIYMEECIIPKMQAGLVAINQQGPSDTAVVKSEPSAKDRTCCDVRDQLHLCGVAPGY